MDVKFPYFNVCVRVYVAVTENIDYIMNFRKNTMS